MSFYSPVYYFLKCRCHERWEHTCWTSSAFSPAIQRNMSVIEPSFLMYSKGLPDPRKQENRKQTQHQAKPCFYKQCPYLQDSCNKLREQLRLYLQAPNIISYVSSSGLFHKRSFLQSQKCCIITNPNLLQLYNSVYASHELS